MHFKDEFSLVMLLVLFCMSKDYQEIHMEMTDMATYLKQIAFINRSWRTNETSCHTSNVARCLLVGNQVSREIPTMYTCFYLLIQTPTFTYLCVGVLETNILVCLM